MRLFAFILAVLLSAFLSSAYASDVEGAADHPLIKRYADSTIIGYRAIAHDEFDIATGPHTSFNATLTEKQTVEGALTRILYVAPEGRSTPSRSRRPRREGLPACWPRFPACS
mgnify:CR=1 FL=1